MSEEKRIERTDQSLPRSGEAWGGARWTSTVISATTLLLFVVEFLLLPDKYDARQGWTLCAITLLPMLFFVVLSRLELSVVERKRREQSGTLIGAYMLFKGLRLLLTLIAVAIYIYVGAPLRMMFVANMLVLFLAALLMTSLCHLHAERSR